MVHTCAKKRVVRAEGTVGIPDRPKRTSARRPVSIQDIAEAAGVSHSTVSRALHNSDLIRPEVRLRVQQLAQKMGYIPNAVAQSLKGQRTHTVGLVISSIADPFAGRVVRGIEEIAQANRISLLLSVSYNDPERELEIIETFQRRRVDGVISATAQMRGAYVQRLTQIKMPTVMINQQADSEADRLLSVDADDYAGARLAVEHLLSLGHRRIGYLGVGNRWQSNRRRFAGYCDTLSAAGVAVNAQWVRVAPILNNPRSDDVVDGQALLPALLGSDVTAVFCYNDLIAVGALMACRELGIVVPEQMSVVGYDDVDIARYVTPPLTTVHQPKLRLGELAMQMLLDLLEGQAVHNTSLANELVVRSSTGPPPL